MEYNCGIILVLLVATVWSSWTEDVPFDDDFNIEWGVISGRMHQPKCVAIPSNMTLCHKIGYPTMRLPNLLEHDNLQEATEQANNWNALIGIRCHPDTQVFLCSLFSPICLERVVYPCRSLCEGVKRNCEAYMRRYGFPWPDMFRCDKFPYDDDLCIPGPSGSTQTVDSQVCKPCQEPDTYEGILHNYCSSDYVVRATIRGLNQVTTSADVSDIEVLMGKRKRKLKFYKRSTSLPRKMSKLLADAATPVYISRGVGCTCNDRIDPKKHHLMGIKAEQKYDRTGQRVTRFYAMIITSWRGANGKAKENIKKALRAIRKNGNICEGGVSTLNTHQAVDKKTSRQGRKGRGQRHKQL